jgi:FkbM family methyltransferase
MSASEKIAVVTSIPPKLSRFDGRDPIGETYQRLCLESLVACGFRILSVNDPEEIQLLSNQYPEVAFVQTDRNASAISGRKTPFIADLLAAVAKAPGDVVGIVNSDILFEPSAGWHESLPKAAKQSVVLGQRHDTVSLSRSIPKKYFWGFDYFFFEKEKIGEIVGQSLPYAMGLPWWDYWFPVALAFTGCEIKTLESPRIVHLDHGKGFNRPAMRQMAQRFVEFVVGASDADASVVPPRLKPLIAQCRKIADFSGVERGDLDNEFDEIARLCAAELQANVVRLADAPEAAPLRHNTANFPNRGEATAFLSLRAISLQKDADSHLEQQRLPEAEQLYRTILQNFPDDLHSLCSLGWTLNLQGRVEEAIALFRKAIELRPGYLFAHVCLGMIFAATDRNGEAVACFKKAISIDPDFEDQDHVALAHYNLARLLNSSNRPKETLAHLEKALFYKPDYPAAAEGYYHLRRALRAPKGPYTAGIRPYFSQRGEDALLDEFFQFKPSGYFVDVGAFDGVHLSNSYAFERQGWSGLCVEAAPAYFELCKKNRPRSRCVNFACVGAADRVDVEFHFEPGGLFSGVSVDEAHVSDVHTRNQVPFKGFEIIRVPSATLDSLLGDSVAEIDFVSIDVEGSELDVLAGFDLERYKPRVLLIEANTAEERKALDIHLAPRGYRYARSITWNHFYVRNEEDRRALRAITVSAKLEHPLHPLGTVHGRFGYPPHPFVYWRAEK